MAKVATPFKAVFTDGREVEAKTLPIDYVIAERHMGQLKQFEGEMYAAMLACKRKGIEYSALDDFLRDLADYITLGDVPAGNSTAPAGGPTSPPSPTGSAPAPATSTPA